MKQDKIIKVTSQNCDLFFFNKFKKFIKTPERIFFLIAKKECVRGNHAHKKCSQFFISLKATIKIELDDGSKKRQIQLKQGHILKIKPMIWVKVQLKKNQILCVICDKKYSPKEYIRNYKVFKELI
jgi:hypothetical protein